MLLWICSFTRPSTALAVSVAVLSLCWGPRLPCFDCSGLRDYCHLAQFIISCTFLFSCRCPQHVFLLTHRTAVHAGRGWGLSLNVSGGRDWLILQNNHESQPLCDHVPRNKKKKLKMTQIIKTHACKNSSLDIFSNMKWSVPVESVRFFPFL